MGLRALTKIRSTGQLYERRRETVTLLHELAELDRETILERLRIGDRRKPGYIPSECLVYLLREAGNDNRSEWFCKLFGILDCRLRHNLVHTIRYGTVGDAETVREEVRSRFFEVLARGLRSEPERLDPFEVMFDGALAALRRDLYGAERRRDLRKAELNPPDDEAAPASAEDPFRQPEAENALGMTTDEYKIFREQALRSIDVLPHDEREPIRLLLQGHKIDAKDPDEMTIAKICDVNERTVRNRIKRGVERLRASLEGSES